MTPTKRYGKKTTKEWAVRLSLEEYKQVKRKLKETRLTHRQWLLQKLGLK